MRLQSAVFTLEDTLLDPAFPLSEAKAREGLDKVLSIFKMESVWLFAVTSLNQDEALAVLRRAGLEDYFRSVLSQVDARCAFDSGTMFEKAARRLRSKVEDTVVFTGHIRALEGARSAGFRTVAVRGCADEDEWHAMCAQASETLERYADWIEG